MSGTGHRDVPEQRGRATDERSHMVTVGTAALRGRFGAPPVAAEFGRPGGCALTGVGYGARGIYPVSVETAGEPSPIREEVAQFKKPRFY